MKYSIEITTICPTINYFDKFLCSESFSKETALKTLDLLNKYETELHRNPDRTAWHTFYTIVEVK